MLGEDLELIVRVWNTLSDRPEDFVSSIEKGILFSGDGRRKSTYFGLNSCIHVLMY